MKINAQKVYNMNNEIRTKSETAGSRVTESYSLSQNGNIVRYWLDLIYGMHESSPGHWGYGKWYKDNSWTDNDSSD